MEANQKRLQGTGNIWPQRMLLLPPSPPGSTALAIWLSKGSCLSPHLAFWNSILSVLSLWHDFVLCPHLATRQFRTPWLANFLVTLTFIRDPPPAPLCPSPAHVHTRQCPRTGGAFREFCHILCLQASQRPHPHSRGGDCTGWVHEGHLKVRLPQVPNKGQLDKGSKEAWGQDTGAYRGLVPRWSPGPREAFRQALIFLSALPQMACCPMTVTRAQCRQQVVLSED